MSDNINNNVYCVVYNFYRVSQFEFVRVIQILLIL